MARELVEIMLDSELEAIEPAETPPSYARRQNGATRSLSRAPAANKPGKSSQTAVGNLVGTLVGFTETAEPLVAFEANGIKRTSAAQTIVPLDKADVNRKLVLAFENASLDRPIIMGVIQSSQGRISRQPADEETQPLEASLDGKRVTLNAKDEITLRCGKASITLTKAGKILIRGAYLLSRSSGVNRIKGGSVQIN